MGSELPYNAFHNNWREQCFFPVISGRISDLLKFLVPKVGESFVLDHNVESQEVAQARPRPELAGAFEMILELAALRLHCAGSDRSATLSHSLVIKMITVIEEVLDLTLELKVD